MKVISIFNSIDGEVNAFYQGRFSTFIRFSGCNLFCDYCDTKRSWDPDVGIEMTPQQIFNDIKKIGCKKVTITGGEPLLQNQDEMLILLNFLDDAEYAISIETNGTLPIPDNWPVGSWIVDYKSSSVGHPFERKCDFKNLQYADWIKFVIRNKKEYNEILPILRKSKVWMATIAIGPVYNQLDPALLVNWLQKDKLFHCVVNLPLHKYIWPVISINEER